MCVVRLCACVCVGAHEYMQELLNKLLWLLCIIDLDYLSNSCIVAM